MISSKIEKFLDEETRDIAHSGRSLYAHLRGTYNILKQLAQPEYICLGGLFHSIYGTNVFLTQAVTFECRKEMRDLIGSEAERLVYIFCCCDRPRALISAAMGGEPYSVKNRHEGGPIPLMRHDLRDLLMIEYANLTEQNSMQMVQPVKDALRHLHAHTIFEPSRPSHA